MSNLSLPHPIWSAVLSPSRSVEVMAWLKKKSNRALALELKGMQGESMLHWAALSDSALTLDLLAAGFDLQTVDGSGRTPLDWLFERLWMTHVEGVGNLTALNLRKLRLASDDLAMLLWRQGARRAVQDFDERWLAARFGLWKFLETVADLEGLPSAWSHLEGDNTVLHGLAHAPDEKGRDRLLDLWKKHEQSVDVLNRAGQTPLGSAVSHRLSLSADKTLAIAGVEDWIGTLVSAGADPNHSIDGAPSPASLPLLNGAPPLVCEAVEALLNSETAVDEGNLPLS